MNQLTAVITGAARGIGAATANTFAAAGWRVVLVDRERLQVPSVGTGHRFVTVDLTEAEGVLQLVEFVSALSDSVQTLVNNAAIHVARSLAETTDEDFERVLNVNLRAPFLLARGLGSILARGAGAIVNVASVHAAATSSGLAAYAASKGALVSLTRALAVELGPLGVRVNAVLPGAVDTEMLRAGLEREGSTSESVRLRRETLMRRTPLGRTGRPEEIAEAILFLSDTSRSSFITGQTLVVDGGALAALSTEVTG